MAATYAGVSGVNRQITKIPVGVGGVNRNCKAAWAGVAGVNRQVFASGSPLSSKAIGNIVKIKESGAQTPFIVLSHGYPASGRTLLLRENIYDNRQWKREEVNTYASSDIDSWLNSTYLSLIDASTRAQIAAVNISYTHGDDDWTVSTLSRRVFLLSHTEMGFSEDYARVEGSPLPYFDSNLKRIGYLNGVATIFWLRSPNVKNSSFACSVRTNGIHHNDRVTGSLGSRPAFTLPSSILLNDSNEIIA